MKSTNRQLERIRHLYVTQVVDTRAKKDFDKQFEVFGRKVGPFVAGNHYKLEFWIAKPFMKNNVLEPVDEMNVDVQQIQKLAYTESRAPKILEVDKFLFTSIREYMDILSSRVKKNLSTKKEFRDLISNVQDLITVRHRKILSLSQIRQTMKTKQNLTEEEKVLMNKLTNNFGDWRQYFLEDSRNKLK